jgi:hypothetical protein
LRTVDVCSPAHGVNLLVGVTKAVPKEHGELLREAKEAASREVFDLINSGPDDVEYCIRYRIVEENELKGQRLDSFEVHRDIKFDITARCHNISRDRRVSDDSCRLYRRMRRTLVGWENAFNTIRPSRLDKGDIPMTLQIENNVFGSVMIVHFQISQGKGM